MFRTISASTIKNRIIGTFVVGKNRIGTFVGKNKIGTIVDTEQDQDGIFNQDSCIHLYAILGICMNLGHVPYLMSNTIEHQKKSVY